MVEEREEESRDIPEEIDNYKEEENLAFKKSSEGWKSGCKRNSDLERMEEESTRRFLMDGSCNKRVDH